VTANTQNKILGDGVDRVDGVLKVTGAAQYSVDFAFPGLVHAALVQSTVAAGTIRRIDTAVARAAAGVLAVITHENVPRLMELPAAARGSGPPLPLKDNRILHRGQHLGIVVAETNEQAHAAVRLVAIDYAESPPILDIGNPRAEVLQNPWRLEVARGDVEAAMSSAAVVYDETFDIAAETNNPMGLFATVAHWNGDRLLLHESTQWPMAVRRILAALFRIPEEHVRVLAPYVGGGFGAGLRVWQHVVLTALAARVVYRPVKLVLSRPQMFTSVGHRPQSRQRLRLGANRDGRLVAIDHTGTSTLSIEGSTVEPITMATGGGYACANLATRDRQVRLNIPTPGAMRAPGAVAGNFAIESALDEISWKLGIDPIELRLRSYADVHPQSGLPWSSKALKECYRAGAERFGWSARKAEIGSMRDGDWLVGQGMASVNYEWYAQPCRARITISQDGRAHVASAGTDIGTGTYTVMTQLAAELLGLELSQVRVELGDSDLPPAPQAGGSGLAISLGGAIQSAAANVLRAFLSVVAGDAESPLRGTNTQNVIATNGRIHLVGAPAIGESYVDIMARHELHEVTADGEFSPQLEGVEVAPSPAFAAQFAEVRIDRDLGMLRVARVVSAVDGGRILNQKLARSQVIGSVIMGIGMTLFEETTLDSTGRIANATFGDYLIPVNADVHDLEVVFVGEPDRFNPLGIKGIGEVGTVGVSAAIANAVFHATGRRLRSLPITIDQLL
jgi:CO/xanthine dehydrogenase Mo-binding subunit